MWFVGAKHATCCKPEKAFRQLETMLPKQQAWLTVRPSFLAL